jgi:heme-degrading monooxygenase HmoA
MFNRPSVLVLALSLTACSMTPTPGPKSPAMPATASHVVARMWHGRVPESRRDEYRRYLIENGIRKLEAIPGNLGADVLERTADGVSEFTVISYWPSLDSIRAYAGTDIEKTHNLPRDPEFLLELEPHVKHFDVVLSDRK